MIELIVVVAGFAAVVCAFAFGVYTGRKRERLRIRLRILSVNSTYGKRSQKSVSDWPEKAERARAALKKLKGEEE